jgi:hypothetical protein
MTDLLNEFEEEQQPTEANRLKAAFSFWFKKRWLYNFILLVIGWLAMYAHGSTINFITVLDIFFWILVANLAFSLGYSLDSFFIFYLPQKNFYERLRPIIFWTGTVSAILVMLVVIWSFG